MSKDRGTTKSASNLHLDCASILKYVKELIQPLCFSLSKGSLLADPLVVNTQANVGQIQSLNELIEIFCQWSKRHIAFS